MADQNQKKTQNNSNNNQQNKSNKSLTPVKKPMIVERVNKFPLVSHAISMGFSQYDRLKSSNANVATVMNRAESWAVYFWNKVQPIVEKLQEPISKADQLACCTLDYVEDKLKMNKS